MEPYCLGIPLPPWFRGLLGGGGTRRSSEERAVPARAEHCMSTPVTAVTGGQRAHGVGRRTLPYADRVSEPPERTPDGRYIVIDGRRWRATDPAIPEERRAELTRALMAWRREVRRTKGTEEERASRAGVQAAKVALGERGTPWWEQSDEEREARWSAEVPLPGSAG